MSFDARVIATAAKTYFCTEFRAALVLVVVTDLCSTSMMAILLMCQVKIALSKSTTSMLPSIDRISNSLVQVNVVPENKIVQEHQACDSRGRWMYRAHFLHNPFFKPMWLRLKRVAIDSDTAKNLMN